CSSAIAPLALSLHDALPIWIDGGDRPGRHVERGRQAGRGEVEEPVGGGCGLAFRRRGLGGRFGATGSRDERGAHGQAMDLHGRADRKSTRLNSSHVKISYAV